MFTSRKILIVEDYGDLFDFLGEAMALLGWESIFAANSQEALDMLEHDTPSTILLNVRAPVTNGINLLASIKAHPAYAKIPVLAAIGRRGGLTRECYVALGCDDVISTPLVFAELEMRLSKIMSLERRKLISSTAPVSLSFNMSKRSSTGGDRKRVAH